MSTVLVSGLARPFINAALTTTKATADGISDLSASSLVEMGKAARVEPITVLDSSLVPYETTTDVLKTLNSMFASFYLSAASITSNTGRIKTVQLLDKLNPARSVSFNIANSILLDKGISMSSEDRDTVNDSDSIGQNEYVPSNNVIDATQDFHEGNDDGAEQVANQPVTLQMLPPVEEEIVSTEAPDLKQQAKEFRDSVNDARREGQRHFGSIADTDKSNAGVRSVSSSTDLVTVANLSVGQLVSLDVTDGEAVRKVEVNIRLIVYPTSKATLRNILTWSERDNKLSTRFKSFRAGELSFWRDVVFMRDLFAERRKALMKDTSGVFQALSSRMAKNILSGIVSLTPSAGTISSIMVISDDTLKDIEKEFGGRLDNYKVRQRIMNTTGLMIIAVVDPIEEYVRIYTYSIALPSEFSMKQIKSASKGGTDIAELIKMINAGSAPSF